VAQKKKRQGRESSMKSSAAREDFGMRCLLISEGNLTQDVEENRYTLSAKFLAQKGREKKV